jgi:hypothetical protein
MYMALPSVCTLLSAAVKSVLVDKPGVWAPVEPLKLAFHWEKLAAVGVKPAAKEPKRILYELSAGPSPGVTVIFRSVNRMVEAEATETPKRKNEAKL